MFFNKNNEVKLQDEGINPGQAVEVSAELRLDHDERRNLEEVNTSSNLGHEGTIGSALDGSSELVILKDDQSWIEQLEAKVKSLKSLEKSRFEKYEEQEKMLETIERLKEELAELQLNYELKNDELEKIEDDWIKSKEELMELAIK